MKKNNEKVNNEKINPGDEKNHSKQKCCFFINNLCGISLIALVIAIIISLLIDLMLNEDILEKKENNNYFTFIEENIEKPSLSIAIDFGNYKTSFSYCFNKNVKEINIGKTQPTVISLFRENLTAKNYGKKTHNSIINYNEKEKSEIYYLNNLKFSLFNSKQNNNKKLAYINKDEKINKKAVIEYLKLFSQGALNEINSNLNEKYIKEEVNWYITVPRFLDEVFKLLVIECAKEAGLYNVDLVLDTEAATLSFLNDNSIHKKYKEKGNKFMLIDLGEYKYDAIVNEIIDNQESIRQLLPPLGQEYNSANINEEILGIIYKILHLAPNEKLKQKMISQNLNILKNLENIVSKFDEENSEYKIYINDLKNNKQFKNNEINVFSYENFQIKYDNYNIYFPGKLIEKIIFKKVNEIIEFLKLILNKYKKIKIEHFILTGGFSNCEILINECKKEFKNIHFSILINQEDSIVKGAIIYSQNPNLIKIIQSHYIYGIKTFKIKNKDEICEKQVVHDNIVCCEIIEKINDKEIKNNILIQKKISPISHIQKNIFILIYRSKNNEVKNSEDHYFGKFRLSLNDNRNWKPIKILLSIKFISYLKISALDYYKKNEINVIFYPKKVN